MTPNILNASSRLVDVAKINPHPRNPRQGDIGAIHTSITENGFYGSIIVQKSTGYIVAGNHRYKAAVEAGMKRVPVTFIDVDDKRAIKILLADNRSSDLAINDNNALVDLLTELAETNELVGTLYTGDDLDELLKDLGRLDTNGDGQSGGVSDWGDKNILLIEATDESHLQQLYDEMIERGLECTIMS